MYSSVRYREAYRRHQRLKNDRETALMNRTSSLWIQEKCLNCAIAHMQEGTWERGVQLLEEQVHVGFKCGVLAVKQALSVLSPNSSTHDAVRILRAELASNRAQRCAICTSLDDEIRDAKQDLDRERKSYMLCMLYEKDLRPQGESYILLLETDI